METQEIEITKIKPYDKERIKQLEEQNKMLKQIILKLLKEKDKKKQQELGFV